MWFLLERFPLPLGAWDGQHYFIVALPKPSIYLFYLGDMKCRLSKKILLRNNKGDRAETWHTCLEH